MKKIEIKLNGGLFGWEEEGGWGGGRKGEKKGGGGRVGGGTKEVEKRREGEDRREQGRKILWYLYKLFAILKQQVVVRGQLTRQPNHMVIWYHFVM